MNSVDSASILKKGDSEQVSSSLAYLFQGLLFMKRALPMSLKYSCHPNLTTPSNSVPNAPVCPRYFSPNLIADSWAADVSDEAGTQWSKFRAGV